jgi:hypothetical protein
MFSRDNCRYNDAGMDLRGTLSAEIKRQEMEFVTKRPPTSAPHSCTASVLTNPGLDLTKFEYTHVTNWTTLQVQSHPSGWQYDGGYGNFVTMQGQTIDFSNLDVIGYTKMKWFPDNNTLWTDQEPFSCWDKTPYQRYLLSLYSASSLSAKSLIFLCLLVSCLSSSE